MTDVPDEYEPEVDTILPRLKHARTPEELRRIIHTEFVKWFDAGTAGPEVNYDGISREIWAVWQRRNRPA